MKMYAHAIGSDETGTIELHPAPGEEGEGALDAITKYVNMVPGGRVKKKLGLAMIPLTKIHWMLLRAQDEVEIEIPTGKTQPFVSCFDQESLQQDLNTWTTSKPLFRYSTMFNDLFQYQSADVRAMDRAPGLILANEQGLGKTRSMAAFINQHLIIQKRALVVAPTGMVMVWAEELNRIDKPVRVISMTGTMEQNKVKIDEAEEYDSFVMVISYDMLRRLGGRAAYGSKHKAAEGYLDRLDFRIVVADEAHRILNPRAQQTRALWHLSDRASRRFALTGTPIESGQEDLWCLLRFIDPKNWNSRSRFIASFFNEYQMPWGVREVHGVRPDRQWIWNHVRSLYVRRIEKKDVLQDLPEKRFRSVCLPMGDRQARQYKGVADQFLAEADDGSIIGFDSVIAGFTRLGQIANGEMSINSDGGWEFYKNSIKADWLLDYLKDKEPGHKAVVFTSSRKLYNLVYKRLMEEIKNFEFRSVSGDTPITTRQDSVIAFQSSDSVELFLGVTSACKEGITLSAADTMIMLDRPWSSIDLSQARDRIHRIGSEKFDSVEYIDLVAEGTIERGQARLMQMKSNELHRLFSWPTTVGNTLAEGYINGI